MPVAQTTNDECFRRERKIIVLPFHCFTPKHDIDPNWNEEWRCKYSIMSKADVSLNNEKLEQGE